MQAVTWQRPNARSELWLALTLGALIAAAVLALEVEIAVALTLVCVAAVVFFFDTWSTLLVLMMARSSIDIMGDVPSKDLNTAALLTLLLILMGTVHVATNRIDILRLPLVKPYLFVLGAWAVSTLISIDPMGSFEHWTRALGSFFLYILMLDLLRDERRRPMLVKAIVLSVLLPLALGLYQAITGTGDDYTPGFTRIYGTFLHSSPYAFYLLTILPFALTLGLQSRPSWGKLGLYVLVPLIGVAVVLTFTRISWLGLVVTVLVLAFSRKRALLLPVLAAFVAIAFLVPSIQTRLSESSTESGTGGWRISHWGEVLNLVPAYQWPTGLGLGAVDNISGYAAHNDYVRTMAETGMIGSAALVTLYGSLVRRIFMALAAARSRYEREIVVAFLAVLVARLAMAVTDNIIVQPVLEWYFWSFAALVMSLHAMPKAEPSLLIPQLASPQLPQRWRPGLRPRQERSWRPALRPRGSR